jgi:hypothetical protein
MHGTVRLPETRPRIAAPTTLGGWALVLLCLAVAAALAVPSFRSGLFDAMATDDAMRLVQVRDFLAGQAWFDLTQHRLDPPQGSLMHWSRLIDAPIAAIILLLRPLIGNVAAEQAALVLWPTLLLAAALALVAAVAARLAGATARRDVRLMAMIAAALAAPALIHFRSGGIDHHNAQMVLVLCFLLFAAGIERSARCAVLAALSATLSLAIGLEMLPAIAVGCAAVLGLLIWRGSAVASRTTAFGATLIGSSALLAVALLPPHAWTAPVYDAFGGPVLLLMAGGGACLIVAGAVAARWSGLVPRLAAAATTGSLLLATFVALYPDAIASPYAAVDPLVATLWLNRVSETMSIHMLYLLEPERIVGIYAPLLITLILAGRAAWRAAPDQRFRWLLGMSVLAALFATGLWQMRGAAAATIVAAPLFVASVAVLWPNIAPRRLLLAVVLLSSMVLAAGGQAVRPLLDSINPPTRVIAREDGVSTCRAMSGLAPLAQIPRGRMLAPIDLGPGILAATEHSVFAAPYHRNNDGNLAMIKTMMAAPDAAHRILKERQVDYVVLCRGSLELLELTDMVPDGLAARLGRGEVPDFLQPVALDAAGNLTVWRVRP